MTSPITLNPGTPSEITADPGEIDVPDLWHIAQLIQGPSHTLYLPQEKREAIGNAILETWYLAHAFRRYLIDHPAE